MKKVFLLVLSEEIPVADADTIDIRMVGSVEKEDGNSLIWFMSGNENQAHYYLPEEKFYPFSFYQEVIPSEYKFLDASGNELN